MNKINEKKEEDLLSHIINLVKLSALEDSEVLKARYLQKEFYNIGYKNVIIDPSGNLVAKLRGKTEKKVLVICANLDNEKVSGEVSLTFKSVIGRGVGEAGIALVSMLFIGEILKQENLEKTVYLVGTADSKKGNRGLNHFLDNLNVKPEGLINIEGIGLGEINKRNISLVRLKLKYKGRGGHAWKDIGGGNPVFAMSGAICLLKKKIKMDNVVLNMAGVNANAPFDMIPNEGTLELEVRGFDIKKVEEMVKEIKETAESTAEYEDVKLEIEEILKISGTRFNKDSSLEKIFLDINKKLRISSYSTSSNFEIAPALLKKIDAVSIGISNGGEISKKDEYAFISSIYKGMEQLYLSIKEFDKD